MKTIAYILSEWCGYAIGAIAAGLYWGHCSPWWLLVQIPLGFLSGFLDAASRRENTPC